MKPSSSKMSSIKAKSHRGDPLAVTDSAFAFSDATPIYVKLILLFRHQIETGAWPVGEQIPVLNSLAEQFGVSRATVRQAISFLEKEGLVSGARGRGTFVISKPSGEAWLLIPNDWAEIVRQGVDVEADWVDIARPMWEPDLSDITDARPVERYHVIRRVLSQHRVPYLIGTSYIDQRIADAIGMEAFQRRPLFDIVGPYVHGIDQSITIGTADAETASLLLIPLNAPTVIVRRAGVNSAGELVYQGEGIMRGDLVRVERRLA